MSDDSIGRKEIPPVVGQIVEDAIDKIYKALFLNDPDARQRIAALIRSYIDGKYFSTLESFLADQPFGIPGSADFALKALKGEMNPEVLRTIVEGHVKLAGAQTVNVIDSILKGELDPEAVKNTTASLRNVLADFSPPATPQAQKSRTKHQILVLYDEYCGKRGMTKAEFVRHIIKLNKMTALKGDRRGISGTNFNNVYRCLNEFLKERRSKAD
jgi:hypothetical protein